MICSYGMFIWVTNGKSQGTLFVQFLPDNVGKVTSTQQGEA